MSLLIHLEKLCCCAFLVNECGHIDLITAFLSYRSPFGMDSRNGTLTSFSRNIPYLLLSEYSMIIYQLRLEFRILTLDSRDFMLLHNHVLKYDNNKFTKLKKIYIWILTLQLTTLTPPNSLPKPLILHGKKVCEK